MSEFYTKKLNCGRNSLRFIIRTYNIKEIFIPYYTCPSVWQAIKREKCKINFYHIDKNFLPTIEFPKNSILIGPVLGVSLFLYTLSKGLMFSYTNKLSK